MVLPEIRLLQATIALAEELNFSRAPERLRIEQSTLSKRIVELESQIDLRLFERNHQVSGTDGIACHLSPRFGSRVPPQWPAVSF
jgi:DNA-binding transcriptional LysR family regulator